MILGIYETKYASFTTVDHDNLTNSWHINPKLHSRGGEEKLVAVESSLHDSLTGLANTGVVHAKRGGVVAAVAQLRDQPAIYLAHLVRCLEEDHRLVEGGSSFDGLYKSVENEAAQEVEKSGHLSSLVVNITPHRNVTGRPLDGAYLGIILPWT